MLDLVLKQIKKDLLIKQNNSEISNEIFKRRNKLKFSGKFNNVYIQHDSTKLQLIENKENYVNYKQRKANGEGVYFKDGRINQSRGIFNSNIARRDKSKDDESVSITQNS